MKKSDLQRVLRAGQVYWNAKLEAFGVIYLVGVRSARVTILYKALRRKPRQVRWKKAPAAGWVFYSGPGARTKRPM